MSEVKITDKFKHDIRRLYKKYPSLKNEVIELIGSLETDPAQGIFLGKGCYKIRLAIASKGRGKSGGGRVVTCVKVRFDEVYLVTIYDKADRESLSESELDEILKLAGLSPDEAE